MLGGGEVCAVQCQGGRRSDGEVCEKTDRVSNGGL